MTEATWRTYDAVADTYARISQMCHAQLARDLVAAVAPRYGATVLDLGAGSGVAAHAAGAAVGADGAVVALDPSTALLARARAPRVHVVAGSAPGLPFADHSFDVAVASLVLGHFDDYRPALADLARVLRPGGRLGVTTWGRLDDALPIDDADERAAHQTWDDVVGAHLDLAEIDGAATEALPWEAWFGDPAHLRVALAEAGLRVVELFGRAYRYRLSHADWLARVDTGARGRYARAALGDGRYAAIAADVLAALDARGIADPIHCADEALLAVATATYGTAPR
jgi:SAM-dependent methyltransferase